MARRKPVRKRKKAVRKKRVAKNPLGLTDVQTKVLIDKLTPRIQPETLVSRVVEDLVDSPDVIDGLIKAVVAQVKKPANMKKLTQKLIDQALDSDYCQQLIAESLTESLEPLLKKTKVTFTVPV